MSKREISGLMTDAEKEKAKRVVELVISKAEKAKRAAELVIANSEKLRSAAVLVISNLERAKHADDLSIADKELAFQNEEKIKRAAEFVIADVARTKREAEIVITKIEKAKRIAKSIIADKTLSFQSEEKSKLAVVNVIAEAVKAKREAELIIANIKRANRSAELVIANIKKAKLSAELVIAHKELIYQKNEKAKRAAEVIIANVEKAERAARHVIANIDKAKRAAELVNTNKELVLAKERAKHTAELILVNEELTQQILKREQTELAYKESNEKYLKAFQTSPYLIIITRMEDGKIIEVNDTFVLLSGYSRKEALSSSTIGLNMWTEIEERNAVLSELRLGKAVDCKEFSFRKKNGEIGIGLYSAKIIYAKKEPNIISSIADITKLKQTESELIVAKNHAEESDRLKSAFLTNMSHEIRTPMNGILGFAGLLKDSELSGEQQQKYIDIIEKSGARMLNIINDIVSISKIESGTLEAYFSDTNINGQTEYVYNILKLDAEKKNLSIFLKNGLPDKESVIKTDNEKFIGILSNLVKNAIKYTDRGSIEFGYDLKKGGPTDAFDNLVFYIRDTGIGIPIDRQEAIFERFIQAEIQDKMARQGAGLGLAISKAYVEMLGGKIWVESVPNRGSTFYFSIPYNAKVKEQQTKTIHSPNSEDKFQLKILIVEDDETSEIFLIEIIHKLSKEVLIARNGIDAINVCRQNPDIDLILMDIQIPGWNGYEATRQIRAFNKDVIIIAQTSFGLSGDRKKSLEAGCNDYISKPFSKEELVTLVQKYFNK